MKYLVKPNFNRIKQQLAIPAKGLNMFMRSELKDSFGFYQSLFGLYSYMQLNNRQKYTIHTLTGQPFMWQTGNSCSWSPTGNLTVGRREFEPCPAKINEEFCHDELFDGCFEHLIRYNGRGGITLDPAAVAIVNEMIRTLGQQAMLGARLTLTMGQLYDPDKIEFNKKATKEIRDLFAKTVGTCKGWIELARQMALDSRYSHMNCKEILDASYFDGKKFTGDIVTDIFDKLQDKAPAELCSMIDDGGLMAGDGMGMTPIFVLSTHIYKCLKEAYRKQCVSVTCMNPRLTQQTMTAGGMTKKVLFIDDIPVMPISDLNCYDVYLTGCTHFAGIMTSGNIGLGTSFGTLPDISNGDQALMIQRGTDVHDMGKYYFSSQSLFAATIADTNFFVGAQTYNVPA